jgi:hypothetical protein
MITRRTILGRLAAAMTIPGLGGQTPPRPDQRYAGSQSVVVAPGSSQIVRARVVIVSGAAGAVEGVFVYQPGTTPGAGNPPIFWITAGTTDPFGNAVEPTAGLTGTGTFTAGPSSGTQVQLASGGASGFLNFLLNMAGFSNGYLASQNVGGTLGVVILQGPQNNNTPGLNDYVQDLLYSSSGAGSNALRQLGYIDANGGTHGYLTISPEGATIEAGSIGAVAPGTGTSPTNPATTETWHSLGLQNGWSASGNGVSGVWYRLLPTGDLELAWDITTPSATPGVIGTLPSGYIPPLGVNLSSGWYGTGPTSYNDTFNPHLFVDTGGNLNPEGIKVSTVSICGTAIVPLSI